MTDNTTRLNALRHDINNAHAALDLAHPHRCPTCNGFGGEMVYTPSEEDGRLWHDCPKCLGQGLNPLDLNQPLTEEEAEDWVENAYEGKYPSEALQEVSDLAGQIEVLMKKIEWEEWEENPDR